MSRIEIIPPVVHREFLVRSRARITYWLRLGAAGTAFGAFVIAVIYSRILAPGMAGGLPNGAGLFAFFSWCLWIFCLTEGVRQSFDMLSGEKREGTIGLLFLTQMRGFDVVLGKVSAGFIASFFPVLGALPILGILILMGGVSGAELVRMSAALLATLGASLAAGIFVSARSIYAGRAWSSACGILLIWILGAMIGSAGGLPIPSPLTLFQNSFDSRYLADPSSFWVSLGIVLGTASLLLIGAGWTIGRKWRETALSRAGRQSAVASLAPRTRREEDRRLLEKHPIAWLASTAWKQREVRATKLLTLLAALFVFVAPSSFWEQGSFFLFIGIFCAILWRGIGLFGKARSSGWLELLLTTPISEREIGEQLNSQVRRWAMKGALLLLALDLTAISGSGFQYLVGWWADFPSLDSMMLGWLLEVFPEFGLVVWIVSEAGMMLLDYAATFCWLYGACWYALWRGLRGKSLGNALGRTLLVTVVVYLVVMVVSLTPLMGIFSLLGGGLVGGRFSPALLNLIINLVVQLYPNLLAMVFFSWLGWKAKRRLPLELTGIRKADQKKNRYQMD